MYTFAIARLHVHHNRGHMGEACFNNGSHTDLCGYALYLLSQRLLACRWLLARQVDVRAGRSAVHLRGSTFSTEPPPALHPAAPERRQAAWAPRSGGSAGSNAVWRHSRYAAALGGPGSVSSQGVADAEGHTKTVGLAASQPATNITAHPCGC